MQEVETRFCECWIHEILSLVQGYASFMADASLSAFTGVFAVVHCCFQFAGASSPDFVRREVLPALSRLSLCVQPMRLDQWYTGRTGFWRQSKAGYLAGWACFAVSHRWYLTTVFSLQRRFH